MFILIDPDPIRRGPTGHRAMPCASPRRWPDDLVEYARKMHQRGVSRGFLARRLGVPYDTMRDWLEYRTR